MHITDNSDPATGFTALPEDKNCHVEKITASHEELPAERRGKEILPAAHMLHVAVHFTAGSGVDVRTLSDAIKRENRAAYLEFFNSLPSKPGPADFGAMAEGRLDLNGIKGIRPKKEEPKPGHVPSISPAAFDKEQRTLTFDFTCVSMIEPTLAWLERAGHMPPLTDIERKAFLDKCAKAGKLPEELTLEKLPSVKFEDLEPSSFMADVHIHPQLREYLAASLVKMRSRVLR